MQSHRLSAPSLVRSGYKRTQQFLALVGDGESPVEFGLSIMRDTTKDLGVRMHAARIVAPYLHPRPAPAGEVISFELPEAATLQNVTEAVAAILKQVSEGKMSVSTGRDLVSMTMSSARASNWLRLRSALKPWNGREEIDHGKPTTGKGEAPGNIGEHRR